MNTKLEAIIEELKTLTLAEAAELVKGIEKTFDVDASISATPVMSLSPVVTVSAPKAEEVAEEKSSFDIILTDVPAEKKIAILKVIRNVTGLGLKESKEMVENLPKTVKENSTKEESETIRKELEAAGAKVTLK